MCSSGTPAAAAARARLRAPAALTSRAASRWLSAPSTSVHAAQLTAASGATSAKARSTAAGSVTSSSARARPAAACPARVDQLTLETLGEAVEDEPVRLEHVLEPAGVLPPAAHDVRLDAHAAVDEVLNRVGDLELAAPGRRDRARGVVDLGGEHVDADK